MRAWMLIIAVVVGIGLIPVHAKDHEDKKLLRVWLDSLGPDMLRMDTPTRQLWEDECRKMLGVPEWGMLKFQYPGETYEFLSMTCREKPKVVAENGDP